MACNVASSCNIKIPINDSMDYIVVPQVTATCIATGAHNSLWITNSA